ncbi:MAG: hypothetical protein ACTSUE_05365 [Promethearchaeota archaeon]
MTKTENNIHDRVALLDELTQLLNPSLVESFIAFAQGIKPKRDQSPRKVFEQAARLLLLDVLSSWDFMSSFPAGIVELVASIDRDPSIVTSLLPEYSKKMNPRFREPSEISWHTVLDVHHLLGICTIDDQVEILRHLKSFNKHHGSRGQYKGNLAAILHLIKKRLDDLKYSAEELATIFDIEVADLEHKVDIFYQDINAYSFITRNMMYEFEFHWKKVAD